MKHTLILATALLIVFPVFGEEDPASDYSRGTLRFLLRDETEATLERLMNTFVVERGGWIINWFPLAAPLRVGGDGYGNASISPTVNPMALLGMDLPGGEPYAVREGWSRSEKRYRRSLVATVRVKNREDNARD